MIRRRFDPPTIPTRAAVVLALICLALLLLLGCASAPVVPAPVRIEYRTVTVPVPVPCHCPPAIQPPDLQLPAVLAAGAAAADWPALLRAVQHDADELLRWYREARIAQERLAASCQETTPP